LKRKHATQATTSRVKCTRKRQIERKLEIDRQRDREREKYLYRETTASIVDLVGSGYLMSPYPTVVMVTTAHQNAPGIDLKYDISEPDSAK
jgi:hypothetical protein